MSIVDVVVDAASEFGSSVTALEAVTAIGTTVGVIGAVTGNKALTVAGAGLAVIGGVGSLAANAGLLGDDASQPLSSMFGSDTATESMGDTAAMAGTGTDAPLSGTSAATPSDQSGLINSAGEINPDAVNPVAQQSTAVGAAAGSAQDVLSQNGAANTVSIGPAMDSMTTPATNTTSMPATAPQTPGISSGLSDDSLSELNGASPSAVAGTQNVSAALTPAGSNQTDMLSSILKFGKDNPMIAYGAIQAGGALLSGLTNPMTPAQIDALNAQAEANRAAASLTTAQAANLRQSAPAASSPAVTGTPQGLINRAPAPQSPVTGVPA